MPKYVDFIPKELWQAIQHVAQANALAWNYSGLAQRSEMARWTTRNDGRQRPFSSNRLYSEQKLFEEIKNQFDSIHDSTSPGLELLVELAQRLAKESPELRSYYQSEIATGSKFVHWEDEKLAREMGLLPPR